MKLFPNFLFRLFTALSVWLCLAPAVRAAVDTVTSTADSGPGSLRDTIAAASPGDTIVFSPTLAGQTIYLTSGEIFIGQILTIDASSLAGGITIDGGGSSRVLDIGGGTFVNLNELTLTNGYAANGSGGGIYVYGATVTLNGCNFSGNSASGDSASNDGDGGAIYQVSGSLALTDCTFKGNSAPAGYGGAIDTSDGIFEATNCVFQDNSGGTGGAVENAANTATLGNCIFSNNIATIAGGIGNITMLTLNNCTLSDNTSQGGEGGGIANGGGFANNETVTLNNCTLSGNSAASGEGGGIYNSATVALNNCTLCGNTATNGGEGGGIMNLDMLTANNCTLSGNSAEGGYGGGIVDGYQMTLNNCTLVGNSADNGFGGGLFTLSAISVLNNCTICSNSAVEGGYGGGIYNEDSTLALTNTIAAENNADNDSDVSGAYSGAANFIGGNPQLAAPGNYGGPTKTMPPLFGSPVIDAGTDWVTNFLATDQRGDPRLVGAHVDIGAVEWQHFVVLNANDSGTGSLRGILTNSPDYVTFTNTLAGQTIYLTSGELIVSNITTIDASALAGGVIIDGGGVSRVFQINDVAVTLNSLTVTNGNTIPGDGGGIENGGTLTLNHCTVSGNSAAGGGGIDYNYHAAALFDCTVSGNSAADGGGFYCYDGTLTLSNCIVSNNSAIDGGGIGSGAATLTLNGCTFSGNSARNIGGGIDGGGLEGGTLGATNCTFSGDSANEGGAMEWGGLGTLDHCTVSTNIAQYGAGILNDYGTLTLNNCTLAANTATNGGGGAISSGAFLTANNCTFSNNSGTNAGAIANTWYMTLNNCTVIGNSASSGNGGGIYNYWILNATNCNLIFNSADSGQGGGIYNWHTLALDDCSLTENTAINGGGIADSYGGGDFSGSVFTADNCSFSGNTATYGGGIFNVVSMALNNCTLTGNSGLDGNGGAIFSESADAEYGYDATNFVVNCTIYGNGAPGGSGGGLYNDSSSTLALTNTIVASNSAAADNDVYGVYSGVANFIGGNPRLVGTVPIFGSPVIDAGTDWVTNFLATDARGFPRLAGAHVDIGAVEAQIAPANNPPVLRNLAYSPPGGFLISANFGFMFTNVPNADFTVIASTNLALPLAHWTVLGNAQPGLAPGNRFYQFRDTVPTGFGVGTNNSATVLVPYRFYRVVSP